MFINVNLPPVHLCLRTPALKESTGLPFDQDLRNFHDGCQSIQLLSLFMPLIFIL
jgi:hypothetical protein